MNWSVWGRLRRFLAGSGLGMMLVLVSAVQGAGATPAGPKAGGTLTVGMELEFRGFDPLKANWMGIADRTVMMTIEERLFDMDAKGNLVPELALSAKPSKDGKSWTIALRKGVTFHDGTKFNADAVVGNWQRLLDPKNKFFARTSIEPIDGVQKLDDFTVRFKLKHPWAAFKYALTEPQSFGAFIPSPKAIREDTHNRAPVGTGPYMFKEWLPNDRLAVVRNPNYWRKGKGYLDKVIFRPMPDMQARFASLQSGESDVIQTDRGASILQAKEDRTLRVYSSDSAGPYNFLLNTAKPPLNDVRVRQALAHAWNQELLLKADYKGTLPLAKDPFGGLLACGDVAYREYDPAKARKLLAEYGKPVVLEMNHTNTPRGKEAGEIMQRLFKEVGVTLNLTPLAEAQLAKRGINGDYQITGWKMRDFDEMGPLLNSNLYSSSPMNFSKYQNPKMDELLTTQQMSVDPKVRKKALCGVAKLINEDAIFLYGGGKRFHVIAKARVKGLENVRQGVIRVSDAWLEK
jgi:4-phytase/acid phosphatase/peptide/nickel transport system substrate-binding protein